MPFINPVSQSLPGFGSPTSGGYAIQALVAAGPTTITIAATSTTPSANGIPFNLNGGPPPSRGKVHVRTSSVNAATTTSFIITVTDGTTTYQVDAVGNTAVGVAVDFTQEFNTDLAITSVSVAVTLAGSSTIATVEVEVSMN
jgi:hypothetical protein